MPLSTADQRLQDARDFARGLEVEPALVDEHLARLPERYPEVVSARAVVRHLLMLRTDPAPGEVRTRVTPSQTVDDGRRELDVVARDTPGLFSEVCGVVSLAAGQVISAEAHTTVDGIAVDTFEVRAPDGVATSWWARFEGDIADAVAGRIALRAAVDEAARAADGETSRRVVVDIDEQGDASHVRVRTGDRLGVLFTIADALAELRLEIVTAHVRTHGDMIDDVFVLRSEHGGPLDDEQARQVEIGITWAVGRLGT